MFSIKQRFRVESIIPTLSSQCLRGLIRIDLSEVNERSSQPFLEEKSSFPIIGERLDISEVFPTSAESSFKLKLSLPGLAIISSDNDGESLMSTPAPVLIQGSVKCSLLMMVGAYNYKDFSENLVNYSLWL